MRKWQKDKQEKKDKDTIPIIEVIATDTSGGKKKKSQDLSGIVYYKCKKNGYYAKKYLEPSKN